ncbi:MAG: response regulator [Chloroflexota bacterium]
MTTPNVAKEGSPRTPDLGRVLVVEDNDLSYELVRFILSNMGLAVLRTSHGDELLGVVTTEHPDLIYMDIQLPGIDGLELTRRLKADRATQHVPVIALTAFAMVGDEEKALAAGCAAYLTKPVSPHQLRDTTQRFLQQLHTEAQHE